MLFYGNSHLRQVIHERIVIRFRKEREVRFGLPAAEGSNIEVELILLPSA